MRVLIFFFKTIFTVLNKVLNQQTQPTFLNLKITMTVTTNKENRTQEYTSVQHKESPTISKHNQLLKVNPLTPRTK